MSRKQEEWMERNSAVLTLNSVVWHEAYMCEKNPEVHFLEEKDTRYSGLCGTRDCVARTLREEGVGWSVKHAEVISQAEEELLWSSEVMGLHSLKALFHTISFLRLRLSHANDSI